MMGEPIWKWFSGTSDEFYENGPFATKQEAVAELDGYGGFIIEAVQRDNVRLSASRLIEDQYFEDDDDFDFDHAEPDRVGKKEDVEAADAELQALLDGWCAKFGHTFVRPNLFLKSRNHEEIPADPQEAARG